MGSLSNLARYEEALAENRPTYQCNKCQHEFVSQIGKHHTLCPECRSSDVKEV